MLDDVEHGHQVGRPIVERYRPGIGQDRLGPVRYPVHLKCLAGECDGCLGVLDPYRTLCSLLDRDGEQLSAPSSQIDDDLAGPEPGAAEDGGVNPSDLPTAGA